MRASVRRLVERVLTINDTPESIALGVALGMFVAMTPTVGIQMMIIVVLGTVVRANRIAGLLMVYISNPITLVPIYLANYYVGALLLGMEFRRDEFESGFGEFYQTVQTVGITEAIPALWDAFVGLGWELSLPLVVGGCVLGAIFGIPLYPITLRGVRAHQRRRERKRALAELRAERRRERELGRAVTPHPPRPEES